MTGEAHDKVWELIPWFVNGRLSEDDAAAVEAHLAECERCRDERHSPMSGHPPGGA